MATITVISVGSLKEGYLREAVAEYKKRLSQYAKVEEIELKEEKISNEDDRSEIERALLKEGEKILASIPKGSVTVALCVEGKLLSSEDLAQQFCGWERDSAKHIVFLIGGSCGLDPTLKAEARLRLSMSPMTFPHHLARVMLLEQVYRAFKINEGSSYHK